jgi:hypothetical protein
VQLYISSDASSPPSFDLMGFLNMLHGILMSPSDNVQLKGRALWCASKFMTEKDVPSESTLPFLSASLSALEESTPLPIRITACRALYRLVERIPREATSHLLPSCIAALCKLLPDSGEETVHIVLDSLKMCIGGDKSIILTVESVVTPIMLFIWQRHLNDPYILDDIIEIFTTFASVPEAYPSLLNHLLPSIVGVLSNASTHASGVLETMVNLMDVLVKNSPSPIAPSLLGGLFSLLLQVISRSDDHSVMQSGAAVLKSYVRKAPDAIAQWSDSNGSGISQILNIVAVFLNPSLPDPAVLYVGPLVVCIVQKLAPHLSSHTLGGMLEAALRRLHLAKMGSLQVELLLVFAALYNTHGSAVIELAYGITLDDSQNGLKFLMESWVDWHHLIIRSYQRKVSIVALSNILRLRNPQIESLVVKGEALPEPPSRAGGGMKTRSKSKANPPRYSYIPLPVKIFSLIINEINKLADERVRGGEDDEGEWNYDEADDDDDEDGGGLGGNYDDMVDSNLTSRPVTKPSPFAPAEDYGDYLYPNPDLLDMEDVGDSDEVEDADARDDPIYHQDVEKSLTDVVCELLAVNASSVSQLVSFLSENDQAVFHALRSSHFKV